MGNDNEDSLSHRCDPSGAIGGLSLAMRHPPGVHVPEGNRIGASQLVGVHQIPDLIGL